MTRTLMTRFGEVTACGLLQRKYGKQSSGLLGEAVPPLPPPPPPTLNFKPNLLQKARPTTTSVGVIWNWHEQLYFAATSIPCGSERDDDISCAEREVTLEKYAEGRSCNLKFYTHYHTRAGLIFYSPLSSVRTTDISSLAPEGWGGTRWTVLPTFLIRLFF